MDEIPTGKIQPSIERVLSRERALSLPSICAWKTTGKLFLKKTECGIFVESGSLTTIIIGDAQIRSFISV